MYMTVGSNIYAVTPTGRILSVLLAALGMMMFPIFTVYVTSLVQNANKRKNEIYNGEDATGNRHKTKVSKWMIKVKTIYNNKGCALIPYGKMAQPYLCKSR